MQAPDWYAVTGLGIALLVAVLITFRKKIRTALSASVKKSKDRKKYKNLSEVEKYRIEKSLEKNIAQNTTKTPEIQYENTIEQRSTGVQFQEKHLTYVEKELITVQRVSIKDMQQLTSLPYQWNSSIKKMTDPHAHPFTYMDLCGVNINIAKSELSKINVLLANAHYLSSVLPKNLQIPVDDIVFKPSKYYGYTRLMCTPYTYSGGLSEYPASLSFMTDMGSDVSTTHGNLFYSQTGKIAKVNIYFWRRHRGHFFYYDTVDGELVLSRVETPNMKGENEIIYKGKHILEWESQRVKEEQDYIWLQRNSPEKCPKSLTGYRRMKAQNTRNYQALKQFSAELGREI